MAVYQNDVFGSSKLNFKQSNEYVYVENKVFDIESTSFLSKVYLKHDRARNYQRYRCKMGLKNKDT